MKRKICFAMLTLTAGLIMVFAAPKADPSPKADPCTEKYNSCSETCTNQKVQCGVRGSTPESCEARFRQCQNECIKAKNACEKKK